MRLVERKPIGAALVPVRWGRTVLLEVICLRRRLRATVSVVALELKAPVIHGVVDCGGVACHGIVGVVVYVYVS